LAAISGFGFLSALQPATGSAFELKVRSEIVETGVNALARVRTKGAKSRTSRSTGKGRTAVKVATTAVGAAIGAPLGAAALGVAGAVGGVVQTVDLKTYSVEKVGDKTVVKDRVPGLIMTPIWGAVGVGLAAVGVGPEHWPLVHPITSWVVEHLPHADPMLQAFFAGAALRAFKNVFFSAGLGAGLGAFHGAKGGGSVGHDVGTWLVDE
jgi:hypothetical protein